MSASIALKCRQKTSRMTRLFAHQENNLPRHRKRPQNSKVPCADDGQVRGDNVRPIPTTDGLPPTTSAQARFPTQFLRRIRPTFPMNPQGDGNTGSRSPLLWSGVALAAAVVWALWPAFEEMSQRWTEEPTYSHGFLVPLFSLALLWLKRKQIADIPFRVHVWGLVVIALAAVLQFVGAFFYIRWLNGAVLLVYLAGIVLLIGGPALLRATWQAIAFLIFMIPLPYRIESALREPLRQAAAVAAAFVMQMIGLPAIREGTIIEVNEHRIGVAEACSGLAMLMTFFALAFAVAILVKRPLLDKLIIVLTHCPSPSSATWSASPSPASATSPSAKNGPRSFFTTSPAGS